MTIRFVPLDRLVLSDLNPRKELAESGEIAALAESIRALGLLQNLIGYEDEAPDCDLIWIAGGGRRLEALRLLAAESGEGLEIPVLIERSAEAAQAAALAENEVRREMNPVDRFRAYEAQRARGVPLAVIARRYAADTPSVERILALSKLAPEVMTALEGGDIDLETARAFTVSDDHHAQAGVLSRIFNYHGPAQIRAALKRDAVMAQRNMRFAFVGEATYLAAGGRLTRDLFSADAWIDDPAVLEACVTQRFAELCAVCVADGWAWATSEDLGPINTFDYDRLEPAVYEPSEEEEAEMARLEDREHIEGDDIDEAGWGALSDEEIARLEHMRSVLDAETWSDDQKSVSGCALRLGYDGQLRVSEGLLRKSDRARALDVGALHPRLEAIVREEIGRLEGADPENGDAPESAGAGRTGPESPAGSQTTARELSSALVSDLAGLRVVIAANHLAASPEMTLDALAWSWSQLHRLFATEPREGSIAPGSTSLGVERSEAMTQRFAAGEEELSFAAFRALGRSHRNQVLAQRIATSLEGYRTAALAEVELEAKIDLRKVWTPGASFLERLTIAQIGALHVEIAGSTMPPMRKAEAVAMMARMFEDPGKALKGDPAAIARAKSWLPEAMLRGKAAAKAAADERACASAIDADERAAAAAQPVELLALPAPEPEADPVSAPAPKAKKPRAKKAPRLNGAAGREGVEAA